MSAVLAESNPVDWDVTIQRACSGGHAADKLTRTAQALVAAIQRSRLRGDRDAVAALNYRLNRVHRLLDEL